MLQNFISKPNLAFFSVLTALAALVPSARATTPAQDEVMKRFENHLIDLSHQRLVGGQVQKPTSLQLQAIDQFIRLYEGGDAKSSDSTRREEMLENLLLGLRTVDRLEVKGDGLYVRVNHLSVLFAYAVDQLISAKLRHDSEAARIKIAQVQDILAEVYLLAGSNVARRVSLFEKDHLASGLVATGSGLATWMLEHQVTAGVPHLAELTGAVGVASLANIGINVYRGTKPGLDPLFIPESFTRDTRREVSEYAIQTFTERTQDLLKVILRRAPAEFQTFESRLDWLDELVNQDDLEKDCNALMLAPSKK